MESIEPLTQGPEKLTSVFGDWPSLHDAEIIQVNPWRGSVEPEAGHFVFPDFAVRIHLWEITPEVNAQGDLVRRHHRLATLRFSDVTEFGMKGFNHQNEIFGLASDAQRPSEGRPAAFRVKLEPAFWSDCIFHVFQHRGDGCGPLECGRGTACS